MTLDEIYRKLIDADLPQEAVNLREAHLTKAEDFTDWLRSLNASLARACRAYRTKLDAVLIT